MNKKRQEQFQEALTQCIEKMQRGATLDACVAEHPEHAEALRPLLEATLLAQSAYRQEPSRAGRARGRVRLEAAITQARARQAKGAHGTWLMPLKAWSAAMAGVVVFGGGFGVVQAASGALPSDTLYPVKWAMEQAQLNWPFRSEDGQLQFQDSLARRRTNEMVRLATRDKPGDFTQATALLGDHVEGATTLTLKSADRMLGRVPLPSAAGVIVIIIPADGLGTAPAPARSPELAQPVTAQPRDNAGPEQRPESRESRMMNPPQATAQAEHWRDLIQDALEDLAERRVRMQLDYENVMAKFQAVAARVSPEQRPRVQALMERLAADYQAQINRIDAKAAEGVALREAFTRQGSDAPRQSPPQGSPATRPQPSSPPQERPAAQERQSQQATQVARETQQAERREAPQATQAARETQQAEQRRSQQATQAARATAQPQRRR